MLAIVSRILFISLLASNVIATTVDCIVSDLQAVQRQTECLGYAVAHFHHCSTNCLSVCHDIIPLASIYSLSVELDALLELSIDDVQASCDFSDAASLRVLTALANIDTPLTDTLDAFVAKQCEFLKSIGPLLSHKVIGEQLRQTRHLTLNLLRSVDCKLEPTYRSVVESTAMEINKQFNNVISKY